MKVIPTPAKRYITQDTIAEWFETTYRLYEMNEMGMMVLMTNVLLHEVICYRDTGVEVYIEHTENVDNIHGLSLRLPEGYFQDGTATVIPIEMRIIRTETMVRLQLASVNLIAKLYDRDFTTRVMNERKNIDDDKRRACLGNSFKLLFSNIYSPGVFRFLHHRDNTISVNVMKLMGELMLYTGEKKKK